MGAIKSPIQISVYTQAINQRARSQSTLSISFLEPPILLKPLLSLLLILATCLYVPSSIFPLLSHTHLMYAALHYGVDAEAMEEHLTALFDAAKLMVLYPIISLSPHLPTSPPHHLTTSPPHHPSNFHLNF